MLYLFTLFLAATSVLGYPHKGHPSHSPNPTPTSVRPPPTSDLPTSSIVPRPSSTVSFGGWMPPQPTSQPDHCGPMESTPVWISTSEGWPLYNMCLDVKHSHVHESAKLVINKCNNGPSQNWAYDIGVTVPVRVSGTNFCVDAGKNPQSGDEVRLSRCDGSSGQQWFPANTGQWILNDRDSNYLCLDIKNGQRAPGSPLQLYPCADWNPNQDFYPGLCWYNRCLGDCPA